MPTTTEPNIEAIALQLLALPASLRADLAERLILSLEETIDADAGELWREEIRRRSVLIREGKAKWVSIEDVLRTAREEKP